MQLLFGDVFKWGKQTESEWKDILYRLEEVAAFVFTKMEFKGLMHGTKLIVADYKDALW